MTAPSSEAPEDREGEAPPWPQQLYDIVWLIAGTAILFWVLSYVVWGLIDILTLPGGGSL